MQTRLMQVVVGAAAGLVLSVAAVRAADPVSLGEPVDKALQAFPQLQVKADPVPLQTVERALKRATPAQRLVFEQRLGAIVRDPKATEDARRSACLLIFRVVSKESVPLLAGLLDDAQLGDLGCQGLASLPYPEAEAALVSALAKAAGQPPRPALLQALAEKRCAKAVPELAKRLGDANPEVVKAALATLGRIGGAEAAAALGGATPKAELREVWGTACLVCAAGLVAAGDTAGAAGLYSHLTPRDNPAKVRAAAYAGLLMPGESGLPAFAEFLAGMTDAGDVQVAEDAIRAARSAGVKPELLTRAVVDAAGKAKGPALVPCLRLVGKFPGSAALEVLSAAARGADAAARDTAVDALAAWPDGAAVPVLLEAAGKTDDVARRTRALQAAVRLALGAKDVKDDARQALVQAAEAAARTPEEKQAVKAAAEGLRITDLKLRNGKTCQVVPGGFKVGAEVYMDRPYTLTKAPERLLNATYIRTVMDDRGEGGADYLSFTVSKPVTVYVGLDSRAKDVPEWLKSWQKTGQNLETTDGGNRPVLYSKAYPAGPVVLGGGSAPGAGSQYMVVVAE